MRFHVLGIGPIGSLLANHLRRTISPQHSITLIHKTSRQAKDAVSRGVIRVERDGVVTPATGFFSEAFEPTHADVVGGLVLNKKRWSTAKESKEADPKSSSETSRIESLFITTKAHQTLLATQRLLPRLSENTTIVLLQNGMGIYEQLVQEVFRNPEKRPNFILASNTHGAWLKGMYNVVHTGVGEIEFGIIPDSQGRDFESGLRGGDGTNEERKLRLEDLAPQPHDPTFARYRSLRNTVAVLNSLEALNTSWRSMAEVQISMRRKLVVNSIINPLTALMGCRNGDIFSTEAARRIVRRVCQEASSVYAAQAKEELSPSIPLGSQQSVMRLPSALTHAALEQECLRVAELTKGNISSMLADVRKGRRTEIEFMNGHLMNLGTKYRIQMPATSTLLNLVKMRTAIPLDQML